MRVNNEEMDVDIVLNRERGVRDCKVRKHMNSEHKHAPCKPYHEKDP